MRRLIRLLPVLALFILHLGSSAHAAPPPGPYFNGFERNADGWFDLSNGGRGKIMRRRSGYTNGGGYADGISSASGSWHARLLGAPCFTGPNQDCTGPHTNWGGYTATFPPGGYLTQVDIYFDIHWAAAHPDTRFDWSSAINQSEPKSPPEHRRDWVFNAGTQPPGELMPKYYVNASTNAFRDSSFPENPCPAPIDPISNPPFGCRAPAEITQSGWYTFRHTFRSGFFAGCPESECLIVDFDILNQRSGATVAHWTIHSSQDPMSMVGGNRYGWFANEEIPDLPIDNSLRTGLCHRGDGDGDVEDRETHKKSHAHFHKKACGDEDHEDDNVESDDDESGEHFRSNSVSASSFAIDEDNQTMTMLGTGIHNGLPVGFTMIAVDNDGLAPGVFTLILSDGYTVTGDLDGLIQIE